MSSPDRRYPGSSVLNREVSRRRFVIGIGSLAGLGALAATFKGRETLEWGIDQAGLSDRFHGLRGELVKDKEGGVYTVEPLPGHDVIARSTWRDGENTELGFLKPGTLLQGEWVYGATYSSPQSEFTVTIKGVNYGYWFRASGINALGVEIYEKDENGDLIPKISNGKGLVVDRLFIAANSLRRPEKEELDLSAAEK